MLHEFEWWTFMFKARSTILENAIHTYIHNQQIVGPLLYYSKFHAERPAIFGQSKLPCVSYIYGRNMYTMTMHKLCIVWSPPITELMLSQMLLWQGGQREANVEHFIGATIGQNSPKSPISPFYEWKYCITKFTHNVLSKNIEKYHTGQEKVFTLVQFLKVA